MTEPTLRLRQAGRKQYLKTMSRTEFAEALLLIIIGVNDCAGAIYFEGR